MKKSIALVMMAVLLVAASVMGTLAFLTSTDSVKNTFTVGKVAITLDEADVTKDGKPVEGAARVQKNEYKLMPGHTYTKDPTIHVAEGSEPCFIRAKVTLTNASQWIAIATKYADNKVENIIQGTDDNIWWVSGPAVDTVKNTVTYTFVFKNESHTDELGKRIWTSADGTDLVLFNEIKIPGGVTATELSDVANTQITIVAEAIQADGFATEEAAWEAFAAAK